MCVKCLIWLVYFHFPLVISIFHFSNSISFIISTSTHTAELTWCAKLKYQTEILVTFFAIFLLRAKGIDSPTLLIIRNQ